LLTRSLEDSGNQRVIGVLQLLFLTAGMDHIQSKLFCGILDLNQKQEMLEESTYLHIPTLSHSFLDAAKLNGCSALLRGSYFSPALRGDEERGQAGNFIS